MSQAKCNRFGHQWNVAHSDRDFNYEQCQECGEKRKFVAHKERERQYAEEHRADLLQTRDEGFAAVYPEAVQRMKDEAKAMKLSEDDANQKLEEAAHALKRSTMTSPFVH